LLKCLVCGSEDLEEYDDGSGKCLYCGKAYFDLQGQIAKGLVGELSPAGEKKRPEKVVESVEADEKERVSFDEVVRRRLAVDQRVKARRTERHRRANPQLAMMIFLIGAVMLLVVAFSAKIVEVRADQLLSEAEFLYHFADALSWVHLIGLVLGVGGAWMFMREMTQRS